MKKALQTLTALSIAFGGYVLAKGITHGIAAAGTTPHEIVAAAFQEEPLRSTSTAMFVWFPAEVTEMRAAMVQMIDSGEISAEALREAVQPFVGPVHALIAGVPDAGLVALLDDQIALHAQLAPEPLVCAQMVVHGPSREVLTHPLMAGYDIESHYADYFSTLNRARYASPGAPATEADFDALGAAMAGFSDESLTALENNRADDPALCGAVLALLQVVRDADFPGAERVRRDFLVGMMSG